MSQRRKLTPDAPRASVELKIDRLHNLASPRLQVKRSIQRFAAAARGVRIAS
jgi:hypothetical protein